MNEIRKCKGCATDCGIIFSLPLAWLPGSSGTQLSPPSLQELLQAMEPPDCFHTTFRLLARLGSTQPAAGSLSLKSFNIWLGTTQRTSDFWQYFGMPPCYNRKLPWKAEHPDWPCQVFPLVAWPPIAVGEIWRLNTVNKQKIWFWRWWQRHTEQNSVDVSISSNSEIVITVTIANHFENTFLFHNNWVEKIMENVTGHIFSIAVFKTVSVFFNLWSNINYKHFASPSTMAFPKHIMKPGVNFLGSNKESFLSVQVQHWSISGKEKGCSFGEWLLRIRGLFNSFAIAVLFQTTNRSLRSASTRLIPRAFCSYYFATLHVKSPHQQNQT